MLIFNAAILLIFIAVIFCLRNKFKRLSAIEKILFFMVAIIYLIPIGIYIFDKYNILSKFHYFDRVDSERWFDFITSYVNSIIAPFISGIILVLITFRQINTQIENNRENKRIENMPILNNELGTDLNIRYSYYHEVMLRETGYLYNVFLVLENIGLNHCCNIRFLIKVDGEEDRAFTLDGNQNFLKKDESMGFKIVFNLDSKSKKYRAIELIIYYSDLLNNEYEKKIEFSADFVDDNESNIPKMQISNVKSNNACLLAQN